MLDIFEITFFGLSNSNVANTVNNESRTVIARRFFTSLPACALDNCTDKAKTYEQRFERP